MWQSPSEHSSNKEQAMLQQLKSRFERAEDKLAELLIGPLWRTTRLTADADMCLLLRIEVPRQNRTSAWVSPEAARNGPER
jgi:hypothetical protein